MRVTLSTILLGVLALQAPSQQKPVADASAQAAEQQQPLLSDSELKSLSKKYRAFVVAERKYKELVNAPSKKRTKARKARSKARQQFEKEWDKKSEKKDLLSSMPDLFRIYGNSFPYDRLPSNVIKDQVVARNTKNDGPRYEAFVPKSYKPDVPTRAILLVPGQMEADGEDYAKPRDFFDQTWKGASLTKDTVFVIPPIDSALDLGAEPDFSRAGEDTQDEERRAAVFAPAGYAQREICFDRSRLLLDAGRGSSKFGLRLATYFPSRFAGLVLRAPEDAKIRYDSLAGLPILLIESEENAAFCAELKKQMDVYDPSAVTIMKAKGDYPYGDLKEEISKWASGIQRNFNRERVVIAPNHDLFKRGYWINIGTAEPLDTVSKADMPFLDAKVDRAANKIEITTRSITNFIIQLNDSIVDLNKEVSIVINGVAEKKMYRRRKSLMQDIMTTRFDPTQIFTVEVRLAVPETEEDK